MVNVQLLFDCSKLFSVPSLNKFPIASSVCICCCVCVCDANLFEILLISDGETSLRIVPEQLQCIFLFNFTCLV